MPNYISSVNKLIAKEVGGLSDAVCFGENINNGSCISGLTRNLDVSDRSLLLNVGNCEYTHCGVGFGMMLNGATAVLFVKQLDFMLLGVDHFVSTYQNIRCHRDLKSLGSFTIVAVAYDHGYQGPQSSFNAIGDICSMARVPGYTLTNNQDSEHILQTQLGEPGFRFIALSQRHSAKELLELDLVRVSKDYGVFQYTEGADATIVCYNFSIPEGIILSEKLSENGMKASLFSVNHVVPNDWNFIKESVGQTGRLVVLDDSKSVNLQGYTLLQEVSEICPKASRIMVKREGNIDFGVSKDCFMVDYDATVSRLLQ